MVSRGRDSAESPSSACCERRRGRSRRIQARCSMSLRGLHAACGLRLGAKPCGRAADAREACRKTSTGSSPTARADPRRKAAWNSGCAQRRRLAVFHRRGCFFPFSTCFLDAGGKFRLPSSALPGAVTEESGASSAFPNRRQAFPAMATKSCGVRRVLKTEPSPPPGRLPAAPNEPISSRHRGGSPGRRSPNRDDRRMPESRPSPRLDERPWSFLRKML